MVSLFKETKLEKLSRNFFEKGYSHKCICDQLPGLDSRLMRARYMAVSKAEPQNKALPVVCILMLESLGTFLLGKD